MKQINKLKITLFTIGVISLTGCNKIKDFGNTNVNPGDISTPATYAILTGVEAGIANWAINGNGQIWIQYFAESQYPGTGLYAIPRFGFAGNYTGQLLNLRTIIQANNNPDEVAVARILTQYIYWNMTDQWGDIPYSQALQGIIPVYDKQMDIYKGIITELKAAKSQFVNSGSLKGDILNNGNITKWKKFANTIRLVMALRLSKKYPGASEYAATEFKAALADGVIDNNGDNTQLVYPGGNFKNPYFINHESNRDDGEAQTIYNILNGFGDGRRAAFGSSNTAVPFGISEADINDWIKNNVNWARALADNQRLETSPVVLMNASQAYLARAEAADRGWTTEDAGAMLQQGVNASFAQWNLSAPPASYFTQTGVVLGAPGTNLKQIATQRYLAAFPDGQQGWSEWRRTGFPVLGVAPAPINPAHVTIPRRYTYSQGEKDLNPAGLAGAITNLPGGDLQESRVWWDQ